MPRTPNIGQQLASMEQLRAASAELIDGDTEPGGASLGTAFVIGGTSGSAGGLQYALTAHHCVAHREALNEVNRLYLRFSDELVSVDEILWTSSYFRGHDFAVMSFRATERRPVLPYGPLSAGGPPRESILVRGCASGLRTQFANIWCRVCGIEKPKATIYGECESNVEMLEIEGVQIVGTSLRGISGAPVCSFPFGPDSEAFFVIGVVREVNSHLEAASRFYATPVEAVFRESEILRDSAMALDEQGLPLLLPPSESVSTTSPSLPYLNSLVEQWQNRTSPLLPPDTPLPDVAVRLVIRESGDALARDISRGYERGNREASLRRTWTLNRILERRGGGERIVILGDPGSGKTTLLLMEAARLAGQTCRNERDYFPVLVSLAEFENETEQRSELSILAYLDIVAKRLSMDGFSAVVESAAQRGRLLFLLDGLDEVSVDKRDTILRQFFAIGDRHEKNSFVISSRKVGFRSVSGFDLLEIAALDLEQQREILLQLCGREICPILLRNLAGSSELRDLAANPMTLTVLAMVARDVEGIPAEGLSRRSQLLEAATRLLISGRHRGDKPGIAYPETAERALANLSFRLHDGMAEGESHEVYLSSLLERLLWEESANLLEKKWRGPRHFIESVSRETGLLVPVDPLNRAYRYLHRGFREYLCAVSLLTMESNERESFIRRHLRTEKWAEVLVLYAGMAEMPTEYLYALLSGPESVALRALAEVDEVDAEVAARVLRLGGDQNERRFVFNRLEEKTRSPAVLVSVLESYWGSAGPDIPRGDLFFIWALAGRIGTRQARKLRDKAFTTIPRPSLAAIEAVFALHGPEGYWCEVPAGVFPFGAQPNDEYRPQWVPEFIDVDLPLFTIARYPVTNSLYRLFDPAHPMPQPFLEELEEADLAFHPVVDVSWYEAKVFCLWLEQIISKVDLPNEFEWEKAAAFDVSTNRKYRFPWGDIWDPEKLNSWEKGPNRTTRVGQFGSCRSPCGGYDFAGNVWEWCDNWFLEPPDILEVVSSGGGFPDLPDNGNNRRIDRGGGWYHDVGVPASFLRAADAPGDRFSHCGFRLIKR